MFSTWLCNILTALCALNIHCVIGANFDNKPFEVDKIEIPANVWKQAFLPTPLSKAKAAATIVVPVHVNQDDDYNEDDDDNEEIIVDEDVIQIQNITVQNIEVAAEEALTEATLNADAVTEQAITNLTDIQDITTEKPVSGQALKFPCSCVDGQCGCCTAMNLQWFRSNACGNISFIPEDFVFDVKLSINNNTVVHRRVSASDPPPVCFSPRRAPFIDICAEITNIRVRDRNAFACLDIAANIADYPFYTASFRCFSLGSSGIKTGLKPKPPKTSGPAPVSLFGNNNEDDDDDREGFFENVADGVFGDGLFGGSDDDDDSGGPFDGIGDAIGGFFEGRSTRF